MGDRNTLAVRTARHDERRRPVYSVSRLVAVDADGKHMKVLVQSNPDAQGQYQDRIINWNPGNPRRFSSQRMRASGESAVRAGEMVYGNVGSYGWPAVFELD